MCLTQKLRVSLETSGNTRARSAFSTTQSGDTVYTDTAMTEQQDSNSSSEVSDDLGEQLLDACFDGNEQLVRTLFERYGDDLSSWDGCEDTPLSAGMANLPVELLGAFIAAGNGSYTFALLLAARWERLDVIDWLFEHHATSIALQYGMHEHVRTYAPVEETYDTAMLVACAMGHRQVVERFVAFAHPNDFWDPEYHLASPVTAAANSGHRDIVRVLLAAGSDYMDATNRTPQGQQLVDAVIREGAGSNSTQQRLC